MCHPRVPAIATCGGSTIVALGSINELALDRSGHPEAEWQLPLGVTASKLRSSCTGRISLPQLVLPGAAHRVGWFWSWGPWRVILIGSVYVPSFRQNSV